MNNNNKKYAVIIATYKRRNKSSVINLKRVGEFLNNQTFKNFKIFLIGDHYEDETEFKKVIKFFPKDKIFSHNNTYSYRHNYFKINNNKWTNGGMLARVKGIKEAISQGFEYYIHLDDDDIWTTNHIEEINKIIVEFPRVDFIVSKSNYMKTILPREYKILDKKKIDYNNFIPRPRNSVHSSWTINLKSIGNIILKIFKDKIDIIEQIKNKEIKEYRTSPFDATILSEFKNMQKQNKLNAIYIPICTVTKKTDCNIPHT